MHNLVLKCFHLLQTTSKFFSGHSGKEESLDIAFKVMIPLAGALILTVLITVAIYRHFRCIRMKKRGKNSAVVKASEGIHLLDKINVVNKNPTYFVSNASGYQIRCDVIDIPAKDIRLLEVVGEGAFGQVYRGMYRDMYMPIV